MLLPSVLATAPRGCIWPAGRVHMPDPVEPALTTVPGAYARVALDSSRGSFGNLRYGDCVEAGCLNAVVAAEARDGKFGALPDFLGPLIYTAVTGFNEADAASDQGTDPLAMFKWWQDNAIAGWRLRRAVAIDPQNDETVRRAIVQFPAVGVVFALGTAQQNQRVLEPDGVAGSWGGHFVAFDAFDGALRIGTSWGQPFYVDVSFFASPAFTLAAWGLDIVPAA